MTAGVRVLCNIRHEVRHDLGEPRGVAVDREARRRDVDGEMMRALLDERAGDLDGARDDAAHLDAGLTELGLAARDAGHVEQVNDEARQMGDLPFDDVVASHVVAADHALTTERGAEQGQSAR